MLRGCQDFLNENYHYKLGFSLKDFFFGARAFMAFLPLSIITLNKLQSSEKIFMPKGVRFYKNLHRLAQRGKKQP